METALLAILILGFAGLIGSSVYFGRRIYAEFVVFGTNVQHNTSVIHSNVEDTLSIVEEIKEVLTEASKLKALREQPGKELPLRPPARTRRFIGLAERRKSAELESLKSGSYKAQVQSNDIAAMEGK